LCKSSNGRTPYELWTGTTLIIHHPRTFGCIAHVKISAPNLKRLLDRSKKMIFVGYELGSATYRCYDPISKGVRASKYVIFDEDAMRDWSGDQTGDLEFDFTMADQIEDFPAISIELRVVEDLGPIFIDAAGAGCRRCGSE
jgi:hypothetical protein